MSDDNQWPSYDREAQGMKPAFVSKERQAKEDLEERKQHQNKLNDIITMLNTPEGLRYFQSFLIDCGVFEEKLSTNSTIYINSAMRCCGMKFYNLACEADHSFAQRLKVPFDQPFPYENDAEAKSRS